MIRSDKRRGRTLAVLALGCAVAWGTGCKKEEAVAPVALDAGVAAVAVRDAGSQDAGMVARVKKPLRFSDVTLTKNRYRLDVTYTLTNPGTAQGRGDACLSLHDDQGLVIHQVKLGGITVKGGTSDTFEDRVDVSEAYWKQAQAVLLYTADAYDCSSGVPKMTSERFQLLPSGQPAPAGTPAPQAPGAATAADFAVSNVRVSQEGSSDNYSVSYVVKNLSTRRVSGKGCLRAYVAAGDRYLEEGLVGDFSLRPGGSETVTDTVIFEDDKHWDEVKVLRLFTSPYGCADGADAENAGITFDKPADIHAPVQGVDAEGDEELNPDNNDAVVDVPDEAQDPVDNHGGDEPYSDSPEDTGH
ncbi:hypothetical protein D7X74_24730 [Corallococcus sp. CA047B]|uniref:hypothetical protein n=1 Tax=Corallococcus sp. CA047B TaxID=2316729 RepID=UPI000EA2B10D|nr:hypothetical protein [Corallococcus sp. CA047B]RKH11843.1 hypothetical protein D7X74_24730 [Corallococcus sp. CA047B]